MEEYELNGPTLEEGRIALNELEKYLKDKSVSGFPTLSNNGRQLQEDRKMMDRVARSERLKHVKGSPLGLTLDVSNFYFCSCFLG